MSRWDQALAAHEQAIETCIAAARAVPPERWNERGAGWSPSQVLRHVAMAYTMVLDDLDGRPPRLRTNRKWQFLLHYFWLPVLLRTGRFGRVKAPREMRPPEEAMSLDDGVAFLRTTSSSCRDALVAARASRPDYRLTHPYFGRISALDMLRIGTAHTLHHSRQLQGA